MPSTLGFVSSADVVPTVTISSVTNFNQNLATLNASVNGMGASTSVVFHYSTSSSFSSYTSVNAATTPVTGSSTAYANITGLSVGTLYYVRCVVTNNAKSVTSSSTSFTTWSEQVFNKTSSTYSITIPTVTPTGSSAVIPSIYNVMLFGGGGGGSWGGGGGGGYYQANSIAFNSAGSTGVSLGVGGGGGNGGNAGGASYITINGGTTYAYGGGAGSTAYNNGYGGTSGSGYGGGTVGVICTDKYGNMLTARWCGGGGAAGYGGNVSDQYNCFATPGSGGAGITLSTTSVMGTYSIGGGGGGGGWGYDYDTGAQYFGGYSTGTGSGGTNNIKNGDNGVVYFRYYAASALA